MYSCLCYLICQQWEGFAHPLWDRKLFHPLLTLVGRFVQLPHDTSTNFCKSICHIFGLNAVDTLLRFNSIQLPLGLQFPKLDMKLSPSLSLPRRLLLLGEQLLFELMIHSLLCFGRYLFLCRGRQQPICLWRRSVSPLDIPTPLAPPCLAMRASVYTPFHSAMHAKQNRCWSTQGPAALFVAPLVKFNVPHLKG